MYFIRDLPTTREELSLISTYLINPEENVYGTCSLPLFKSETDLKTRKKKKTTKNCKTEKVKQEKPVQIH